MSEVLTPGPTRIVLIRAGQYDYADISLGKSAHLVGRNNAGKTSLISALQFLYIDDERRMQFSRGIEETKRYYFKHDTSYILFECVSADGRFVTVGLRGTGQIGGYGIERFVYVGSYHKSDFIDDQNRVLDFDNVKANLSGKEFALMSPKDIRDSLLGNPGGSGKGISLGIVPLQDVGRYKDFVDLFKNILHLSDLGQKEIKDTLLSVNRRDLHGGKSEINLANEYDGLVSQLNNEKEKLSALEKVEPLIENMKTARERRDIARRDIPALYHALSLAKTNTTAAISARRSEHEKERDRHQLAMADISSKLTTAETQRDALSGQKGVAEHELSVLDKLLHEFEGYLPQMEAQSIQNLEGLISELSGRIHNVQPVAVLAREIELLEAEIHRLREQRNSHSDLLGTRLVGAGQDIHDVFRLFNPSILGLRTGDEIIISDEQAMLQGISSIRERIVDGVFHGGGVSVALDAIAPPGSVSATSVADLDAMIAEKTGILEKKKAALDDSTNVERTRVELRAAQQELNSAIQKAVRYREFEQRNAGRKAMAAQIVSLSELLGKNGAERESMKVEQLKLRDRLTTANDGISDAEREMKRAMSVTFRAPDSSWKTGAPDPTWAEDLYTLNELYGRTFKEYDDMDAESSKILRQIGLWAPDIVRGASQEERMNACEEALNSLVEHRAAYAELLSKVVIGMRSTFDGMLRALEAIKGRGTELNKRLGVLKVSNLRNLKVEIFEIEEQTRFYRSVVDSGGDDLLADVGATEAAVRRIHDKISKAPVLRLSDWFGVRFVVENGRGETKRYDDLASIESNGTTMTIKLLVNIILIKSLLRTKRACMIPFWIDEATQIDPDNLREIVELANENGFCPVLASTNSVSIAEYIYAIQLTTQGRSVIVNGGSLHRTPRASNDPAAA
ncbi:MAG: hypothetical protein HY937_03405 [Nitrosomonadales bacterium]|nr:hypothetical protein [Nitrosomonadales bacterium]